MKRAIVLSVCLCSLWMSCPMSAQNTLPMAVNLAEESSNMPPASYDYLTTRLKSAVVNGGMGSTDDFTQFYLTCSYNVIEKHIVPGAPAKHFQTIDMNFFVVDAFAGKVFTSTSIEVKGAGNSEEQANTASVKQFSPTNGTVVDFLKRSSLKIISYYETHLKEIINKADILAAANQYEEALFQLSLIPEACAGYSEVLKVANTIFKKYKDYEGERNLAKATAIWNAGQNSEAAYAAAVYLSQITPDVACYKRAEKLNNAIRAGVKSDMPKERAHEEKMTEIRAWRDVGIAFGNNQRETYYHKSIL